MRKIFGLILFVTVFSFILPQASQATVKLYGGAYLTLGTLKKLAHDAGEAEYKRQKREVKKNKFGDVTIEYVSLSEEANEDGTGTYVSTSFSLTYDVDYVRDPNDGVTDYCEVKVTGGKVVRTYCGSND